MMRMMRKRRQGGFTLIELLIVVAIIGIIAALLIPNFLESLQKAKQKRTMADMRSGGTAMMAWLTDYVGAAAAGQGYSIASYQTGDFETTYDDVATILEDGYVNQLPQRDGWKNTFHYMLNTGNPLAEEVMGIYSGGRDGDGSLPNALDVPAGPYDPQSYNYDIFWADGGFVAWPEKTARSF